MSKTKLYPGVHATIKMKCHFPRVLIFQLCRIFSYIHKLPMHAYKAPTIRNTTLLFAHCEVSEIRSANSSFSANFAWLVGSL